MRPTFFLRLEHDVVRQVLPTPVTRILQQSEIPRRNFSSKKVKFKRSKKSSIVPKPDNERASYIASLRIEERRRTTRQLKDALLNHWGSQRLSLVDVSLYQYALPTDDAPIEMVMADNEVKVTSTYSPPPPELIWDPYEPQTSFHPIHKASSVALALRQLGYYGRFYNPEAARSMAKMAKMDTNAPTLATTPWPVFNFVPEEGEHPRVAQLVITSNESSRFRCSVILTLPSPYVLPRFSLFRRIFREPYAQQLLSAVWKWTRSQKLHQFTPTAIAIMTGYFLQRTQEPVSDMRPRESFASFLRYWSLINELHKDTIISICDPEQPLQSPLMRWTSNFSAPGREPTANTQPALEEPQPMYWRSQPLIIRDPYAVTQNHAEGVSLSQLNRFASGCQKTLKSLDAGGILVSIFKPTLEEQKSQSETLSQVPQGPVLSAETLIDMKSEFKVDDLDSSSVEKGKSSVSSTPMSRPSRENMIDGQKSAETVSQRSETILNWPDVIPQWPDIVRTENMEEKETQEDGSDSEYMIKMWNSVTSSLEAVQSSVPSVSLTSMSSGEAKGGEDESLTLGGWHSDGKPNRSSSLIEVRSGPEVQEAAFVDRIVNWHLLPPVVHQPSRVWLPWYVPGYEGYEAAFVDEVFAAELSLPSSYPLDPLSLTSPVPAQKAKQKKKKKIDPIPESVKVSLSDRFESSSVHSFVEPEDISFFTEVFANSAAAEAKQLRVLNKVRGVLKEKYGPRYRVEPFGSSRYGITTLTSDLDLVILDPSMRNGHERRATPLSKKLYDPVRLSRWLNNGGFKVLKTIPKASVPIVKFLHRRTGMQCDICVNERLGLLNSELLATYCRMSPLLRPMLLFIKLWAKPRGLNTPASEARGRPTFSSYALALMTVNFLQMRGLLPNLQADLPPLNPIIPGSVYHAKIKSAVVACDVRHHSDIEGWEPTDSPSLREILADWFTFWGEEFEYANNVVSIRHGRVVDAASCAIRTDKKRSICVLDPFIVDKNVAQAVTDLMIQFFMMECRDAAISLRRGMTLRKLTEDCRTAKRRIHLSKEGKTTRSEKLRKMLEA